MEKVNFSKAGPYSKPRRESRHYASRVCSREAPPQWQPQMHLSIRGKGEVHPRIVLDLNQIQTRERMVRETNLHPTPTMSGRGAT
jgi:hypothetical protein